MEWERVGQGNAISFRAGDIPDVRHRVSVCGSEASSPELARGSGRVAHWCRSARWNGRCLSADDVQGSRYQGEPSVWRVGKHGVATKIGTIWMRSSLPPGSPPPRLRS